MAQLTIHQPISLLFWIMNDVAANNTAQLRIAVIGGGIAGLTAAYLLAQRHRVTLLEARPTLGGDSRTVDVALGGRLIPVDTGFIVYNHLNYPNLTAFLAHLNVETESSDMSFGVSAEDGALEYAGTGLNGLFAQRLNATRPQFIRMLLAIRRFYRRGPTLAGDPSLETLTLGRLLQRERVPLFAQNDHILPMAAAIWTTSVEQMREFPAEMYVRFFDSHRLFSLGERPRWRTVTRRSRSYVERIRATLADVRTNQSITRVVREPGLVAVTSSGGTVEHFDHVVIATHGDHTLKLLGDPSAEERSILGSFRYGKSRSVLHGDPLLMPRRRRVWSSWNYIGSGRGSEQRISVTYWLNRLQNIDKRHALFASLNPVREPAPRLVYDETVFEHPLYDLATVAAQQRLGTIQGTRRTWYCGASWGYGFHEDGVVTAIEVARRLGVDSPWQMRRAPQHSI